MKMTFRWYGDSDPVSLEYIRQIPGMYGVVSAIYDVPVGEVWPVEKLQVLRQRIESAGLAFEVVESIPVLFKSGTICSKYFFERPWR